MHSKSYERPVGWEAVRYAYGNAAVLRVRSVKTNNKYMCNIQSQKASAESKAETEDS